MNEPEPWVDMGELEAIRADLALMAERIKMVQQTLDQSLAREAAMLAILHRVADLLTAFERSSWGKLLVFRPKGGPRG